MKELENIASQQKLQCTERREAARKSELAMQDEARREFAINRRALAAASRAESLRRDRAKANATTLQSQMQQKLNRDAERDAVYANCVTDAFFSQFQTSHR